MWFLLAALTLSQMSERALGLCNARFEACVAIRCDSAFMSASNVNKYMTCLVACEAALNKCEAEVKDATS